MMYKELLRINKKKAHIRESSRELWIGHFQKERKMMNKKKDAQIPSSN